MVVKVWRWHYFRLFVSCSSIGALLIAGSAGATSDPILFQCHGYAAPPAAPAAAKFSIAGNIASHGSVRAVVIYAGFPAEVGPGARAPVSNTDLFDAGRPGSLRHFFRTMSFGQFDLDGEVLPRRYAASGPPSSYINSEPNRAGAYARFAREVVEAADRDVDFGRFDNDGPDGRPNSGDDDGIVDYVFINIRSVPRGFIYAGATGKAGLGFTGYETNDKTPSGQAVTIRGANHFGSILQEGNLGQTVGVMAHEFGHALGLPDLYDTRYEDPVTDSAGIGKWGLMGHGALGWDGTGPVGFSAWSLEQLQWLGRANSRLDTVWQNRKGAEVRDLFDGGRVLKIALPAPPWEKEEDPRFGNALTPKQGYLLLEARRRQAHYYNRGIPSEGVLVWHIRPDANSNADENKRLVDLVCADGLFADGGYGTGRAGAHTGGDNLDFWSHDAAYTRTWGGNLGDATDPFDGVRRRGFGLTDNPSVGSVGDFAPAALAPLDLRLQRRGQAWSADIAVPSWAGLIEEEVEWYGVVSVDGDLEIGAKGKVKVRPGTRVVFAPGDRLAAGRNPHASEFTVRGGLELSAVAGREPVHFEALESDSPWYGLIIEPSASTAVRIPPDGLQLHQAANGLTIGDQKVDEMGLVLRRVEVVDRSADNLAGNGDGQVQRGETFQMAFEVINMSLRSYTGARFKLAWNDSDLEAQWGLGRGSVLHPDRFDLLSGQVLRLEMPALTAGLTGGEALNFTVGLADFGQWSTSLSMPLSAGQEAGEVIVRIDGTPLDTKVSMPVALGPVLVEAEVGLAADGVAANRIDLLVHQLNGAEFGRPVLLAPVPGRPRVFRGYFTPPSSGIFELVPRLYQGADARLADTRLWVNGLVDEWKPNLVVWDRSHGQDDRLAMQSLLEEMGVEANYLNAYERELGRSFGAEHILRRYLDAGSSVIWLSADIAPNTQQALGQYLQRGGAALDRSRAIAPASA